MATVGALLLCASCATSSQLGSPQGISPLKNWALSRCLSKAGTCEPAKDDAAKSAAAYLEMGKAGIDVYEKLDALVGTYLARTYSGSVKGHYNTMKCIDLYQSEELDALVRVVPER